MTETKEQCNKRIKEYYKTPKGSAARNKYFKSSKGIAAKKRYHRSKKGLIVHIHSIQIRLSKERSHQLPVYTKEELITWCLNQPLYHELHKNWVESGHKRRLTPSVDRIDSKKSYFFGNIQLMTTYQNVVKGVEEGPHRRRKVIQITLDGKIIKIWPSINAAARGTGQSSSAITQVLTNQKRITAGGFKWKYLAPYVSN